jgi:hypothetical protein
MVMCNVSKLPGVASRDVQFAKEYTACFRPYEIMYQACQVSPLSGLTMLLCEHHVCGIVWFVIMAAKENLGIKEVRQTRRCLFESPARAVYECDCA